MDVGDKWKNLFKKLIYFGVGVSCSIAKEAASSYLNMLKAFAILFYVRGMKCLATSIRF